MLSSNLESPLVSETSVTSDFEESFDVFSQLGFKNVGCNLKVLSFFVVSLSVEEPSGYSVSFRFVDEFGDGVGLSFVEFSGSEFRVDSENFADEEAKSSSDTFDFIESEGDSSLSIDVGVENTMNVFEVVLGVLNDQ